MVSVGIGLSVVVITFLSVSASEVVLSYFLIGCVVSGRRMQQPGPPQTPDELFSAGYLVSSPSCEGSGRRDGSNLCATALTSSARLTPNGKQTWSRSGSDICVGRRRQDDRLEITPIVRR